MLDLITQKRPVRKKALEYRTIRDILISVKMAIYKWEGLPESVRPEYLESYLTLYGIAAIAQDASGEWVVALCERGGSPDSYGLGTTPIISTLNGYTYTYSKCVDDVATSDDGKVAVICYNNNIKSPDQIIAMAAEMLTEGVISLYQNIIHSRYNPLYTVSSDIIKRAIDDHMSEIIAGKPVVIVADNILDDIETGRKAVESVNLTEVDKQECIQYISHAIDDVLRWILTIYGQAIQGNGKLAQQTVDEVNGSTSASFIIPEIGWRCRQDFCDRINKALGWNVTVSYNKPWTVEVERYTEDVEEDPEEPEEEPKEEPEEEPEEEQEKEGKDE